MESGPDDVVMIPREHDARVVGDVPGALIELADAVSRESSA
ncbi:MAG: hypothetical protein V2G42_07795 [bacterium JZ-2024 1]